MTMVECMLSALNIFEPQAIQNQIEEAFVQEYTPISALQHGSDIEFVVEGTDNQYLDLANSTLYLKVKITTAANANPAANNQHGPINNLLDSIFSHVDVELCDKQISDNNGLYAYRAYLENLLSYSKDVQDYQLQACLFIKDTHGDAISDFQTVAAGTNLGFKKRAGFFPAGRVVELIGRPHCDLFHQDLLILDKCRLKLKFIPNRDPFVVKYSDNAEALRIVIQEARLNIRKVRVSPSLKLAHEKVLQSNNTRYPLKRVTMKHLTIATGQSSALYDNIYMGTLPDKIVMGLVADADMAGARDSNPFNFQHFNLNYLALYVNGELVPNRPYQPNFTNGQYIKEYMSLFEGMEVAHSDKTVAITREEFGAGYTIFVFDLTPDKSTSKCINPHHTGNVRVELKFSQPTPQTINLLLYSQFESLIEIDKWRNVLALGY